MTRKILLIASVLSTIVVIASCQPAASPAGGNTAAGLKTIWLDQLDVSKALSGTGPTKANKSFDGNSITLAGEKYEHGLGTHSPSQFILALDGNAKRFYAVVGVDEEVRILQQQRQQQQGFRRRGGTVEFKVVGDGKVLWHSSVMRVRSDPNIADVNIVGVKQLRLIVSEVENNYNDHADWAMAKIEYAGKKPYAVEPVVVKPYILTPKPGPKPRITGPAIFGVRPGNPFLFTVTATGSRPMSFAAKGLPDGLSIDSATGQITGSVKNKGNYTVVLIAKNDRGIAQRNFRIVVGGTIALTPPMGWNSWNCWACAVDDLKVSESAKAMVDTGLINHGWSYINIDDCWMRMEQQRGDPDPNIGPPARDPNGNLILNAKFIDMKALVDYIHSLGLKAGIYIGPGPTTCQGYVASWQHELQDAKQFAEWGFDYLKYDWCGYSSIVKEEPNLEEMKRPYILMRKALDQVPRDIVYSICQYGMGDVWKWGEEVGGNCWRTTGDITDTWPSMARGFQQAPLAPYAKPGHWNDPDMMVLGKVGWGPDLRDSGLTADEQYTHMSLWCLLCSPLLLGCPLDKLDEFTLSLLTNDEVLEVNQDALGQQASRIVQEDGREIWAKQMEDGSTAVGLFNTDDYSKQRITLNFADIGFEGKCLVRDLWRQKNLGAFTGKFTAEIPVHGVVLIKVTKF
jgi:alpha-galactosidase